MVDDETISEIYSFVQGQFETGASIVVGSGLSIAEGIPGMWGLAEHLKSSMPSKLDGSDLSQWEQIAALLDDHGLEAALLKAGTPSELLDKEMSNAVCDYLLPSETAVMTAVMHGDMSLRLSSLISYLAKGIDGELSIITTNYDRLVELACEKANMRVNTMFDGALVGRSNADACRNDMTWHVEADRTGVRRSVRPHARVYKPHGSFDWYNDAEGPVRYHGKLDLDRLIINPGQSKYRKGYDIPFSDHRESMNEKIAKSSRLVVIGYGFQDGHLETQLRNRIRAGVKTLILTRDLSTNARELCAQNENVIALSRKDDSSTAVFWKTEEIIIPKADLWDVGVMTKEMLL